MWWFQVVLPGALTLLGVVAGVALSKREKGLASSPVTARLAFGQLVALASAVTVATLLVVFLFFNPYNPVETSLRVLGRMSPKLFSAGLAAAGGVAGRASFLVSAFAIGFFPWWIGPYLLGTPGIFKWISIAELGYLAAAWLIARGSRHAPVSA
jgi:hypothetical protein